MTNEAFSRVKIDAQRAFEQRCSDVHAVLTQQQAATGKAEAVFQSLLARSFSRTAATHRASVEAVVA